MSIKINVNDPDCERLSTLIKAIGEYIGASKIKGTTSTWDFKLEAKVNKVKTE